MTVSVSHLSFEVPVCKIIHPHFYLNVPISRRQKTIMKMTQISNMIVSEVNSFFI